MCVLYGHQVIIRQQMEHYLLLLTPSVSFPTAPPPTPHPPEKHLFFFVVVADVSVRLPTAVSTLMRSKHRGRSGGGGVKGLKQPSVFGK